MYMIISGHFRYFLIFSIIKNDFSKIPRVPSSVYYNLFSKKNLLFQADMDMGCLEQHLSDFKKYFSGKNKYILNLSFPFKSG